MPSESSSGLVAALAALLGAGVAYLVFGRKAEASPQTALPAPPPPPQTAPPPQSAPQTTKEPQAAQAPAPAPVPQSAPSQAALNGGVYDW